MNYNTLDLNQKAEKVYKFINYIISKGNISFQEII